MINRLHGHRWLRTGGVAMGLASLQLLQACKGVLDVSLPGKVPESALASPGLAITLVNGVQADFECAYSEYVHDTGLWSNELNALLGLPNGAAAGPAPTPIGGTPQTNPGAPTGLAPSGPGPGGMAGAGGGLSGGYLGGGLMGGGGLGGLTGGAYGSWTQDGISPLYINRV